MSLIQTRIARGGGAFTGGTLTTPLVIPDSSTSAAGILFGTSATVDDGLFSSNGVNVGLTAGGTFRAGWSASGSHVSTGGSFTWGTTVSGAGLVLVLARDADGVLAQRHVTNPQTFRIYGTFTNSTNYERLSFATQAGVNTITTEAEGTGTLRNLNLGAANVLVTVVEDLTVGGIVKSADGANNAYAYGFASIVGVGISTTGGVLLINVAGSWHGGFHNNGFSVRDTHYIGWQNSSTGTSLADTRMFAAVSHVIEMRNGTNPYALHIYSTQTDTSNYERLEIVTAAGDYTITPTAAGTGTLRDLNIGAAGITTSIIGRVVYATVTTLANDATPTVAASNLFKTGGTTTITDLDDGVVGQTIRILSAHAITITDGTNILLNGSANFVMAAGDVLVLTMYNDQVWVEDSRQVN